MTGQSVRLFPGSTPGAWTIGLILAMPVFFILGMSLAGSLYEAVPAGSTIPADIGARPFLALSMLAGMVAGVSAFIVGLFAIFRKKESALLVYASTVIGGLLTLYLIGELIFPH